MAFLSRYCRKMTGFDGRQDARRTAGGTPPLAFHYRTSKFTAVPANTFSPAAGFCDTIMLPGNGAIGEEPSGAGAVVTPPTRSPASCTVWVAVPSGCPTKLGITRACGCAGVATSKLIFGAETPLAFGGGAWARTSLSGASGRLHLGDGADVQTAASDVDIGGALALSDHIREWRRAAGPGSRPRGPASRSAPGFRRAGAETGFFLPGR